jgi:CBS domain-containing protein
MAMPRVWVQDATELTVADVLHKRFSALPADVTIGAVRAWFEDSPHRRMAFLADGERYVGSLTAGDIGGDLDPGRQAVDVASDGPTVAPELPANSAYELALQSDARRVPVVDHDGRLLGVVAVTEDLAGFCGAA